jgi:hypothetical protein
MAGRGSDLSDPKVREQVLKERKKMDCKDIFKGTARDIKASVDVLKYVKAELGLGERALATLSERATIIGQARRELCELYKSTPDFTYKEYLAQTDKNNAMIVKLFALAEAAQTAAEQGKDPTIAKSADFRQRQATLKEQLASLNQQMEKFIEQTKPLLA